MTPPIHALLPLLYSPPPDPEPPMPRYVDGFLLPVPRDRIAAYRAVARKAGKIWKEYGALEYVECMADDVPDGQLTSFPRSVKLKKDEVVVFSYIVYRSRKHRDSVNAKVMADPRIARMDPGTLPFDARRMMWGGFDAVVDM